MDSKRGLLRCLDLQTSNMTGDSWKTKEFRAEAWISVKNSSCLHLRPARRQLGAVCRLLGDWSSTWGEGTVRVSLGFASGRERALKGVGQAEGDIRMGYSC